MKKKLLLLLSALIVVPAWAGDVAPSSPATAAPAGAGVVIVLKGAARNISALVAELEKETVYKEAACASASKPGKTAKISCAKADAGLMAFLGQYASAKVQWHISGATTAAPVAAPVAAPMAATSTLGCATGCTLMNCPPPGGPVVCCKRTTTGYKPC
jgi:hypothetical protein